MVKIRVKPKSSLGWWDVWMMADGLEWTPKMGYQWTPSGPTELTGTEPSNSPPMSTKKPSPQGKSSETLVKLRVSAW